MWRHKFQKLKPSNKCEQTFSPKLAPQLLRIYLDYLEFQVFQLLLTEQHEFYLDLVNWYLILLIKTLFNPVENLANSLVKPQSKLKKTSHILN